MLSLRLLLRLELLKSEKGNRGCVVTYGAACECDAATLRILFLHIQKPRSEEPVSQLKTHLKSPSKRHDRKSCKQKRSQEGFGGVAYGSGGAFPAALAVDIRRHRRCGRRHRGGRRDEDRRAAEA